MVWEPERTHLTFMRRNVLKNYSLYHKILINKKLFIYVTVIKLLKNVINIKRYKRTNIPINVLICNGDM